MSEKMTKQTASAYRAAQVDHLRHLRRALGNMDSTTDMHLTELETFVALAMRVMAKTNLAKLRDEARTVELTARIGGRAVIDVR